MANKTVVGAPVKAVGGLSSAALGTALPTDSTSELDAAFTALGLLGEDGLSETENRNQDEIRAWGGSLARVVQTKWGIQVTFTFLERTTAVLKEVRGEDNVTETTATQKKLRVVKRNSKVLPRRSYVAQIKDGENALRLVYPEAQIGEVGDVQYTHSDLVKYEVTLNCYEDESGNAAYEYDEYDVAA